MRAIEFRGPDRVPFASGMPGTSDIFPMVMFPARNWQPDYGYYPNMYPGLYYIGNWRFKKLMPPDLQSPGYERQDEFGCIWKTVIENSIGEVVGHPLKSLDDIEALKLPNPHAPGRFAAFELYRRLFAGKSFVLGMMDNGLWERMHFLRGFSELLMEIATQPERVGALADCLVDEWYIPILKRYARYGCHGVIFTDDWGMQHGGMISPKSWVEIFKPRYKRLFDAAHDEGMKFFMHSCGHIRDILHELIDAGLDVIQKDDICFMGLEELAAEFAGKICFMGSLDIQRQMPGADDDTIVEETRRVIREIGSKNGGLIGMYYAQPEAAGCTWRQMLVMRAAFLRNGKYPINC
ncbi:uroporphyrinogen decarboxylase family protein [bacterium]